MRSHLVAICVLVFALIDIFSFLHPVHGMSGSVEAREVQCVTAAAHPLADFLDTAIQPGSVRCKLADVIVETEARMAVAGLATLQFVERGQLFGALVLSSNRLHSLYSLGVALRL